MKILSLIIISVSFAGSIAAQSPDSTLEVRLELLQQTEGKSAKGLTVGMSIINHSNLDIYIPGFRRINVHFYEQNESRWKELNIYTHDYYKNLPKEKFKSISEIHAWSNAILYSNDSDEIANYYKNSIADINNRQKQLLNRGYGLDSSRGNMSWIAAGQALFLKANEQITYYNIYSIDYLLQQHKHYRISFNSEEKEAIYATRKYVSGYVNLKDSVMGYKLYFPHRIITNTIYYTTIGQIEKD